MGIGINAMKRVAVAMSGGVDSSVAAALLLEQGYQVMGMTMAHLPLNPGSEQAGLDAAAVCRQLGIPHRLVDLRDVFNEEVIQYFLDEYLAGRTPNPCVTCNRSVKWGALLQAARQEQTDLFATGHYSRVVLDRNSGRYLLKKALYQAKDQSYALWRLSQEQLSRTLFPLGELTKEQVRAKASELGLAVAQKSESQEICFIPDDDFRRFIIERLRRQGKTVPPGDFVDRTNKVLGRHPGYPFFTIGQRKGLGIALGRPVFVTEIDGQNNRIRLGDKQDLLACGLYAVNPNWIAWLQPEPGVEVEVRIRYKDPGYPAVIEQATAERVAVLFLEPRPAVTPGQSAVFYQHETVVGGGIISAARRDSL